MKEKFIKLAKRLHKKFIEISLILIYFIGFGITYFFAKVFNPRLLREGKKQGETFWNKPEGYTHEIDEALRQS